MKPKVLIIPSWYPTSQNPVRGIFFMEQAKLMQNDFDVKVLYFEPSNTSSIRLLASLFKNKFSLPLIDFSRSANQELDTKAFRYPKVRRWTDENNFKLLKKSVERTSNTLLKNWKPDIIHAHTTFLGGIIANIISDLYNIPFMLTEHFGPFLLYDFGEFYRRKILETLSRAELLAAVSYDKARMIMQHGVYRDIEVVGNFVDDDFFTPLPRKNKIFTIIIVASTSYIKDLPTFFKALAYLKEKNENFRAIIVGYKNVQDNLPEDYFIHLAKQNGVYDKCNFIPLATREEIRELYRSSNVFVSTSIAEGFQVSVLEALSCGIPVISTANGSFEDIFDPRIGFMVKIRDYKAIAEAILKIKYKDLRYHPQELHNFVTERYGKKAFASKIKNLYQKIL